MNNSFTCNICGSENLAYHLYAKCLIPIKNSDGSMEYLEPTIDIDDYMEGEDYFCCLDCQSMISFKDKPLKTEKELLKYFNWNIENEENI